MGAGFHGGFGNTRGAKVQNSTNQNTGGEKKIVRHYVETKTLRTHIENPDVSGSLRSGVKGGHREDNFRSALNNIGARIVKTIDYPGLDGIKVIYYQLPKKDISGKPTSEFRNQLMTKTVYDHNKLSTHDYIAKGLEAANNSAKNSNNGRLSREWSGVDNQGITWRGYCDSSGNITSFYPE